MKACTTWMAASGSASLTVTAQATTGSEPWPYDGQATLDLPDGACFESPDAAPVFVAPISFSANVGWLAG